jgi:hypothetical protein
MTATLSGFTIADYKRLIREKLKAELHQPVPEKAIPSFISAINKESEILLIDAGCVIALSLIENGHNPDKIFVAEGFDGEYKAVVEKMSERFGFHHIALNVDKLPAIMKFDYVLGNPPFSANNNCGNISGSGTGALWWKITINSLNLLKKGGVISFITPQNLFNGGDQFRDLLLGGNSQYDVLDVNFDIDSYFNVGTTLCKWTVRKSKTDVLTTINDGRVLNLKETYYLSSDLIFDSIVESLVRYNAPKFDFNTKGHYDPRPVKKYIQRNNLPGDEKFCTEPNDIYKYPVHQNGKIKYGAVPWKDTGTWRIFMAWLPAGKKTEFLMSKDWSAGSSSVTMKFDSEEDCKKVFDILNTPEYLWILDKLISNGRTNPAILRKFPAVNVAEILSEDQLNYIQSHL